MTEPSSIEDLLDVWEQQQGNGNRLPPEEFILRYGGSLAPEKIVELRQALLDLESMDRALHTGAEGSTPGAGGAGTAVPSRIGQTVLAPTSLRVERLHARGGLGEVYVAADEHLGREVALKMIQSPRARTAASRGRFLREARLTSRLQHPGVVPVYGSGEGDDGTPFYVMRFVSGRTLQEAVRDHRQSATVGDSGARRLAFQQLLRRFVSVCDTIAYAHSRGVVHRDLKPSNIMAGEFGETLVVDWGLAGAGRGVGDDASPTGEDGESGTVTREGAVLGTPAYMSPEQAGGRVDLLGPSCDVYGLGAVLYAILTGRPPVEGPNTAEILLRVRDGRFDAPRRVAPEVSKALEAVCLKAMATAPGDRYASAADLGREVERWLADEPVLAYRDPLAERVRRWGRRNRSLVSAGVVLLVVGVLGLGFGLWAVGREQARTEKALREAEANLAQSEANLGLARRAVDECFNVAKEHPLFQQPRLEKAKKLLLEKTLPFYLELRSQRPDDPGLRSEQAEQFVRVAYIENTLGRFHQGLAAFRRARDIQSELVEDQPDVPRYRHYLATTHNSLGVLLASLGKSEEAIDEHRHALDIQSKLVNEHPRAEYRSSLAGTHSNLGAMLDDLGKREEAFQEHQRAFDLQIRLVEDYPDVAQYQQYLASTHSNLGVLLDDLGNRDEAAKQYQQARKIRSKLAKDHPEIPQYQQDLASIHNNLGVLFSDQENHAEALRQHERAREIRSKLVKDHPDVPKYHKDLASTYNNMGAVLFDTGKSEEALKDHQQAREIRSRLAQNSPDVPEFQQDLATTHYNCGMVLSDMGKHNEGLQQLRQARDLQSKLFKSHPKVQAYLLDLSRTCLKQGAILAQMNQFDNSLKDLDEGILLADGLLKVDPRHPQVASYQVTGLRERAKVLIRLARYRDAEADWTRALTITPAPQRNELRLERAETLARSGEYRRAAEAADELGKADDLPGFRYQLACIYALTATNVARDATRPLPERERHAGQYAGRAVALLIRAAAGGHFRDAASRARLDENADLAVLRDREDYKEFRKGLKPKE